MKASDDCLKLIRQYEGFSQTPYLCPAGIPTIGYGSTRYADGVSVSLTDDPINQEQADAIMFQTLVEYENAVNRYVTVPVSQSMFDALVDFAYNCGAQNLRTSTLIKKLNSSDFKGAAMEFGRWIQGGGKVLPGLVKRRMAERTLFERDL
jgi:lysozyme